MQQMSDRESKNWAVGRLFATYHCNSQAGDREGLRFSLVSCLNRTFNIQTLNERCGIVDDIPLTNSFSELERLDADFESGEMQDMFRSVRREPQVKKLATRALAVGPNRSRHRATAVDMREAKKPAKPARSEAIFEGDPAEKKRRITNVTNALRRINDKYDTLQKAGNLEIAKYILRSERIGDQLGSKILRDCDWMQFENRAIEKGHIYWAAYCRFFGMKTYYCIAGHLFRHLPSAVSIGLWIRDLTRDGDVEANPGPICVRKMDEISAATKLDTLLGSKVEFKMPLQHWAHHRLTEHASSYGYHFGDLAPMTVPHYSVQAANNTIHNNVPLPLRESVLWPRELPLSEEDGGIIPRVMVHADVRFTNDENGLPMPGERLTMVPRDPDADEEDMPRYMDDNGEIVDPLDDEGVWQWRRYWPEYYRGQPLEINRGHAGHVARWVPFVPLHDRELHMVWEAYDVLVDGDGFVRINYDEPREDEVYSLTSGCPVLFLRNDKYPNSNVDFLNDTKYTQEILAKITPGTAIFSHRPEPVIRGYRRADLESYIMNFKGFDRDGNFSTTFGAGNRMRLDMTSFNCKLGLILAWYSFNSATHYRGVDLTGQPQVVTPWIFTRS